MDQNFVEVTKDIYSSVIAHLTELGCTDAPVHTGEIREAHATLGATLSAMQTVGKDGRVMAQASYYPNGTPRYVVHKSVLTLVGGHVKQKAELEALEMMLKHGVLPGQAWHAYENKDLGSPQVGHLKFVKCGVACSNPTPPAHYPHDSVSQGHMYCHIGTVDMVTGEIIPCL